MSIPTRRSQKIQIGPLFIGGDSPILIQSMCSTKTVNIDATVEQIERLVRAGAGLVRLAVDTDNDVQALSQIRARTDALLSVDLQENFRLAEKVAPYVQKIRYNPGHLHHREPELSWKKKVEYLVETARKFDLALRIGVNCGSIAPDKIAGQGTDDSAVVSMPDDPMLASALEHSAFLKSLGFNRFCVSIKDSHPENVLRANRWFASVCPEIPIHLGVTEAGMPPWGITKSRLAMEPLLSEGIGDTLRVSLTVPSERKEEEVQAGQMIVDNVQNGTIIDPASVSLPKLNIVSCPSCSRVQNGAFVALAEKVREATAFARDVPLTIAVMGCRVNGPGETDSADIGLWCGPDHVNLKEGPVFRGSWKYEEIIEKMLEILAQKGIVKE